VEVRRAKIEVATILNGRGKKRRFKGGGRIDLLINSKHFQNQIRFIENTGTLVFK